MNSLLFKHLAVPTVLHVCECGLVASLADRIKVFDVPIMLREMYHISDIREVSGCVCEWLGECAAAFV